MSERAACCRSLTTGIGLNQNKNEEPMERARGRGASRVVWATLGGAIVIALVAIGILVSFRGSTAARTAAEKGTGRDPLRNVGRHLVYQSCLPIETSGLFEILARIERWKPDASLEEIGQIWRQAGPRLIEEIDRSLPPVGSDDPNRVRLLLAKYIILNAAGENSRACELLGALRSWVENDDALAQKYLSTIVYNQGVVSLRRGENENCIMCRGETSCILPIAPAAIHTNPVGSQRAIGHFSEYLALFPGDLGVRWLLNVAHMTLGEHPEKVNPQFRVDITRFVNSEFDIGRFRDVGHVVGVNRFNQSGGAIMEDFDNDGLLDLAVTTFDCTGPMSYYRNRGDGTFEDRSKNAGVTDQLGGLVCYQADYDNDGRMDIFIPRGAWFPYPIRPSLLRNAGGGRFTDVTKEAGLLHPVNSNSAAWADFDNDGWVDLFVGSERQHNLLFRNKRDGTFEEVAAKAGVQGDPKDFCKGCTWIDYDNDDYPDLYLNNMDGSGCLYHNKRHGTFTNDTAAMGIYGPVAGFSCWTWDYDNDGWLDIFATCYDRSLGDVVNGLLGKPHARYSSRLYHNSGGKGFENVARAAGLDMVFATMGSNFADFDNDGWLDMYLGTGDPGIDFLVPNRMFKNVDGKRFADISVTSGTAHLQKGHGVTCGDWDRDGDVDLFVQTGGAIAGDKYHNVLFQNPGQGNHWLTVKLIGSKTNRAAIGARIKVVTSGEKPLGIHRQVSSGSSFGANTLQQTIGLAQARHVALLEIHWPTSKTTQIFRNITADQSIEVTEFDEQYRKLDWKPIPAPK
jgi:hypothetical protein